MIESATNWNALQSLVQDGRAGNAVDPELFASFTVNDLLELDAWAGVSEGTAEHEPDHLQLQEYMRRSLRVIDELMLIGLQPDKAVFWFRNFPISELNNKTPMMLLADDQTTAVIAKLNSVFKTHGDTLGKCWELMRQDTVWLEEDLIQRVRMYDAFEAARLCGIAMSGQSEFLLARHLGHLGTMFYFMRHRRTCFPVYQFAATGPKPIVKRVLQFLAPYRSGWEVALWFSASNGWLNGRTPEELMDSHPRLVIDAAKQDIAEIAGL